MQKKIATLLFIILCTFSLHSVSYAHPHPPGEFERQVSAPLFEQNPQQGQPKSFRSLSSWEVFAQYIELGYIHILPKGLDHIFFVLGLFLLSSNFKTALSLITMFTVAHSITLSLAVLGYVRLPSAIVEPAIALSIAFVAIENIITQKIHWWRKYVVFILGLIHGMGFASVLMDLGIPMGRFLTALISFNLGVELGQITIILMAVGLVSKAQKEPYYRERLVIPGSTAIAAVGLLWAVERIFFR